MSKRQLMRCDKAVTQMVSTMLLMGMVSVLFSIVYIQVVPMFQQFADSLKLTPTVVGSLDNGTLKLMMTQGLPVDSWTLSIDGTEVRAGTGFFVGKPITYHMTHNSSYEVSLVENSGYPRLIYYAYFESENNSTPPEEEQNNTQTVTCYLCINGTEHSGVFNGTTCPGNWSIEHQNCTIPEPPTRIPYESCTHRYTFDNTLNDSIGNKNWVNHGATFVNNTIAFSGGSYVDNATTLDMGRVGTVSFWGDIDLGVPYSYDTGILGNDEGYFLIVLSFPSGYEPYLYNGEQARGKFSTCYNQEGWNHWVVTFNGTDVHFFFNGMEVTRDNIAGSLPYTIKTIGKNGSIYTRGYLDDLMVFNVPLTPEQVVLLFEAGRAWAWF